MCHPAGPMSANTLRGKTLAILGLGRIIRLLREGVRRRLTHQHDQPRNPGRVIGVVVSARVEAGEEMLTER